MKISMTVLGADSILAKVRRATALAGRDPERITNEYGQRLVDQVQQNASGRPGPNVITGQYRAGIRIMDKSRYSVTVGTDAVQARRLEFGFVGVDAIGRHYAQPAFPHFRPASDQVAPQYFQAMRSAARSWWR